MILFAGINAFSQSRNVTSTRQLAQIIDQQYKDSMSKIEAAYRWVTTNISYDDAHAFAINHGKDPRAKIDVAFKNRKGVCENFAAIFSDVCEKMGFPSEVIEGYTSQNNIEDKSGHSWSAVFVNDDWRLFDPTWDAGRATAFLYFNKTENDFIQTHKPYDPMWQLLHYPVSKAGRQTKTFFNFKDSISAFLLSDSLQKFESSFNRIEQTGIQNTLTETHKKILQNNIEIERQDEQMLWFNKAVDHLNQTSTLLNEIIDARNLGFDASQVPELRKILAQSKENLDSATAFLNNVDHSKATLVYGTQPARTQLKKLATSYLNQKLFFDNYVAMDRNGRKQMPVQ